MDPKVLKRTKNRQWYHQRFDAAPMYIFEVGEAEVRKEPRKPAGTEAKVRVCFFHQGKADWYLDMADIRRGSRVILNQAKTNPKISSQLMAKWKTDEQRFARFFVVTQFRELRKLTDADLLKLYRQYHTLATNRFTSSAIIDHFALGTDEHLAALLRKAIGKVQRQSEFTEIFSALTAPTHHSFVNVEETGLLRIAISPSVAKLKVHQQKYYWIQNNYFTAKVLPVSYFRQRIGELRHAGINPAARLAEALRRPGRNARRKRQLIRKYRLSPFLQTVLKISDDFTHWQDDRKHATLQNIHLGFRIVGEMARRRKVDFELTKYLLPLEGENWFTAGTPSTAELRRRQRGCAVVIWNGGYTVVAGPETAKLHATMFSGRRRDQVRDLRGLTASLGRVSGPVRIVQSATECGKVKAGDILVAVMTRPDYVPAMKRAAAIVTNEGGITCHAAIVSRELGIPCIIGTKIATEVLKDGDIVEVNANHAVVIMIKRK